MGVRGLKKVFHLNVLNSLALYQSGCLVREHKRVLTFSLLSSEEATGFNWTRIIEFLTFWGGGGTFYAQDFPQDSQTSDGLFAEECLAKEQFKKKKPL